MLVSETKELRNVWALDTGCSQHITHRKKDFVAMQSYTGGPISGIGGTQLVLEGQGTVELACVIMLLSNALYCPTAGVNLISASQLLPKRGVDIAFFHDHAKIRTSGRTFTAAQRNGLYLLDMYHPES